jgi:DNA topoisomerase I
VKQIVTAVAEQLGNTPTVCRKSYIHPAVIDGYMADRLPESLSRRVRDLRRAFGAEPAVLEARLLAGVEKAVRAYLEEAARAA